MSFAKFLFIILLASCAGEIDAGFVDPTKLGTDNIEPLEYSGVLEVNAISHDKLEIFFPVANGGNENLVYKIFINESDLALQSTASALILDPLGRYRVTLDSFGLRKEIKISTVYKVRVEIFDPLNNIGSASDKSIQTQTFNNETAQFRGITSASVLPGVEGLNSILVNWQLAEQYGSVISPNDKDVSQYEIKYVSSNLGYRNLNDDSTPLSPGEKGRVLVNADINELVVNGLNPDTRYYFQVRAIHNGYVEHSQTIPGYKKDENTAMYVAKTLSDASDISFLSSSLRVDNAKGTLGLDSINVDWDEAIGPYYKYYLIHKQVNSLGDADELTENAMDNLITISDPSVLEVSAGSNSTLVSELESFKFYQFKLVVCTDAQCEKTKRLYSDLRAIEVAPELAPFYGISSIDNAKNTQEVNEGTIHLNFSSPLVSLGYLTELRLNCHSSSSNPSPSSSCDWNIVDPTNLGDFNSSDFGGLEGISIQPNGGKPPGFDETNYCFSLQTIIDQDGFTKEMKESSLVIKCITPEERTPNIVEFPGKLNQCDLDQNNLTVSWADPTAGLYSNFLVFWKVKDSNPFDMANAIAAFENDDASQYQFESKATGVNFHEILNLDVGKSYHTAVITYQDDGGGAYRYSEINSRNSSCAVPIPAPKFNEWVEVISLGSKVNGLLEPFHQSGKDKYISEHLDDDGIPVEVQSNTPDEFDGVFGENGDQTSSTGIIRLTWKDNLVYGTQEFNSHFPEAAVTKSERKIGYRVYRSDDNRLTWTNLTNNFGLIKAVDTNYFEKVDGSVVSSNLATFTDYSVAIATGEKFGSTYVTKTERARVYWYKVVPVYQGAELEYEDELSNPQHIIRVLLPPPNMALVHRWIANRTMCKEMNKPINKEAGGHYTCDYLGLGSSPKSIPWVVGQGVYDLGGDLLVDRFELGCNFTRGAVGTAGYVANTGPAFDNVSKDKLGCTEVAEHDYPSGNENVSGPSSQNLMKTGTVGTDLISGDCIGRQGTGLVRIDVTSTAANRGTPNYMVPGISGLTGGNIPSDHESHVLLIRNPATEDYWDLSDTDLQTKITHHDNFFDQHMTKSEFGAVYKSRATSSARNMLPSYVEGTKRESEDPNILVSTRSPIQTRVNTCIINLPYLNPSDNLKSRWMGALTQMDQTIQEVSVDEKYYNNDTVKFPGIANSNRISLDMPIVRAGVSNNAKLPPMDGMAPVDLHRTCGTFEVEVGHQSEGSEFEVLRAAEQKRAMRRKEFIAASAWSDDLNVNNIIKLEKGESSQALESSGCNSYGSTYKPAGQNFSTTTHYSSLYPTRDNEPNGYLMTGSSSVDGAKNSEECVSKYGIQDLVGNFAEYTTDEIFCDAKSEHIVIGKTDSGAGKDAAIAKEIASSSWFASDIFQPWTVSEETTGRCSSIEVGAQRSISPVNNGIVRSLYENGSTVADYVRKLKTFDQEGIEDLRAADGNYLDFGQTHFGGPINRLDRIAMEARTRTHNPNFGNDAINEIIQSESLPSLINPAIGIPLECSESSSEFGCGTNSAVLSDLKAFGIKTPTKQSSAPTPIHIGNSENYSMGMADLTWNNSARYNLPAQNNYLLSFTMRVDLEPASASSYVDGSFTFGEVVAGEYQIPEEDDPIVPQEAGRVLFTMDRAVAANDRTNVTDTFSKVSFINGGDLRYKGSGRYSLLMSGRSDFWLRFPGATPTSTLSPQRGGRCVIKVKYDY